MKPSPDSCYFLSLVSSNQWIPTASLISPNHLIFWPSFCSFMGIHPAVNSVFLLSLCLAVFPEHLHFELLMVMITCVSDLMDVFLSHCYILKYTSFRFSLCDSKFTMSMFKLYVSLLCVIIGSMHW